MSGAWLTRDEVLAALGGAGRMTLWRLGRHANFPEPVRRGFFDARAVRAAMLMLLILCVG